MNVKSAATLTWAGLRPHLGPLGVLAGALLWLYAPHWLGQEVFLGNFDRLNSFLNTLWLQMTAWREGGTAGWDETMFTGRNLYALPFTYPHPLNWTVAWFPSADFYTVAGNLTILLHILSGWAAYAFLQDLTRHRWASCLGALLYQGSALAMLKSAQNDMSFAVLIDIPLILLVLRRVRVGNVAWSLVGMAAVVAHLLLFCFLQKVAYALILGSLYALTLTIARRDVRPALVWAVGGLIAAVTAAPRIAGVFAEMGLLQRQVAPGFDMKDFEALYRWQNFKWYDVWRWFEDGLFGRFFREVFALQNNMNITEGMLLFMGAMVPWVVLAGLFRWEGRWGGLFWRATAEVRLFYALIALSLAVVASPAVYQIFWTLFLKLDFTHTRFLIAALIPQAAIVALTLAHWRRGDEEDPAWRLWAGLAAGVAAYLGILWLAGPFTTPPAVALTDRWSEAGSLPSRAWQALNPGIGTGPSTVGEHLARFSAPVFNQVTFTLVFGVLLLCARSWRVTRRICGGGLTGALAGFMAANIMGYGYLHMRGEHLRGPVPFATSHSYWPAGEAFGAPSAEAIAAIQTRLENSAYRTVLLAGTADLPLFTAPHVATTWGLRVVEGYSSGVPARLALLPWATDTLGLRTMTFGGRGATTLPWALLGFTNVKQALSIDTAAYRLGPAALEGDWRVTPNPARVTPRVFIPRDIRAVESAAVAAAAFFPEAGPTPTPAIDPTELTLVESAEPLPAIAGGGSVEAEFSGGSIKLRVQSSDQTQLVVLNELYHPGWRARAGGRELPVLPVNVYMRGILVPAGVDVVNLRFLPTWRPIKAVATGAAAICFMLLPACWAARRWDQPPAPTRSS